MASAVRHIKTKAIKERAEKETAKENAKAWYARSVEEFPSVTSEGGTSSTARVPGQAWEDNAQAVEPPTPKPKKDAKPQKPPPTGFWKFQPGARRFYESTRTQILVAVLIMLNFLCNIVEKEIDPQGIHSPGPDGVWRIFEHVFNSIFLVELLINMYARWLRDFWCDNWNLFDFVVVCIGCVSFIQPLDGPLKLFRTLRALRVLKLFKRVKSLNKILLMIGSAIPGVSSAFAVMVISISIFALIGVEFFSNFGAHPTATMIKGGVTVYGPSPGVRSDAWSGDNVTELTPVPDCSYVNDDFGLVGSVTSREICFGYEYFGTFTRAWYTLFQVLTGESWSEAVARPILFGWNDYGGLSIYLSSGFFILFVIINAFILFNVFVAVLLDKVVAPDVEPEDEEDEEQPEGITLYPWADPWHQANQPPGGAPAAAPATPGGPHPGTPHMIPTPGGKPTPAKMMETLTLQLGALMKEQHMRAEEARKLQEMLGTVLERLERLEEQK